MKKLINGKWRFDIEKTEKRRKLLSELYIEEGLNADNFSCKHYEECYKSIKNGCIKQYNGGTCSISPFYDTYYDNIPIRILIIGKEMGYMKNKIYGTSSNFNENCKNVLNCIGWKKKNNHIKGTLLTLQNIFGIETEYVYSNYVLSNHLRCSYQKKESINNVSSVSDTRVMRDNCIKYLLEEIKILEPTLIITQGEWAIKGKKPIYKKLLGQEYKIIMSNKNKKYGLYKLNEMFLLTSHHPAILGNWIKNLAPDSVFPMLEYLRENKFLPIINKYDIESYTDIVKPHIDKILTSLESNDLLRN